MLRHCEEGVLPDDVCHEVVSNLLHSTRDCFAKERLAMTGLREIIFLRTLNTGNAPGYLLILFTPGDNFETFAYQMAQVIQKAEGAKIVPATHPILFGQLMFLFQEYGLEFVPIPE